MRAVCTSRRLTVALATGLVALACAGLTGCGSASGAPTTAERLVASVRAAAHDGGTVTMTSVAHIDWDRGAFVCPSDTVAAVEQALDATWTGGTPPAAGSVDVLITSAGAVVQTLTIDLTTVDACAGDPALADRTFGPTTEFTASAAAAGSAVLLTRVP